MDFMWLVLQFAFDSLRRILAQDRWRKQLVSTLNLGPFEVRVIWDTGASKTIGGMYEEEAIFRGANHVRIGAGIDWRDDCGDLSKAGGVAANFLSLEEKVWSDGIDGDTQTQAA